jgi:hypothetical protein
VSARSTWALLPLLFACGGESGDPPPPDLGTPFVQIGTGTQSWAPLTDGQTLRIAMGPQGGYHLWGALRAGGLNPEDTFIEFRLVRDGVRLAESGYRDSLRAVETDGPFQYWGVAVVVISGDPTTIADRPARLEVTLTPQHGEPVTDAVEVVPIEGEESF